MTTPATTIGPDATVAHAARCVREHRLGWLPVVDDAFRVVGVLGRSTLLEVFSRPDAEIREEVAEEVFAVSDHLTYRFDEQLADTDVALLV